MNPFVGRDLTRLKTLSRPKRVLVVGGGPAGLTAAAASAARGARVRLIEKRPELGGALHVADRPPFKDPLFDLAMYLENEARSAGVEIDLNREFRPDIPEEEPPDELIMATGALPRVPDFVLRKDSRVVTAESVLRLDEIAPGRYLVFGGGLVGLETAEYLADHGADVTVAEMLDELGAGLGPMRLKLVLDRLGKAGVNMLTGARVMSVQDGHVRLEMAGGEIALGPYRFVVLAAGYRPARATSPAAWDGVKVRVIGDARTPRSIREAITEGLDAALDMED